jgi:Recombination endonuclease VII
MSVSGDRPNQTLNKICLDCGEDKPLAEFSYSPKGVNSRSSYCKICMRARSKASYRKRRAAANKHVREARLLPEGQRWCPDCGAGKSFADFPKNRADPSGLGNYCKPCHNARGRESRERLYGGGREYHLRRRYGIGQEEVDRMIAEQDGQCAGCGRMNPEHVDHDHATGKVRGLLCFNCNQALGNVRDDPAVLIRLVTYLRRTTKSHRPIRCQEYDFSAYDVVYESSLHLAA